MVKDDITYMRLALEEAKQAYLQNEVPVGAILVHKDTGDIVVRSGNLTIKDADPTSHAEITCIRKLCKQLGVQRIPDYDLYVTLEPCPMCSAAISYARINRVIFGATDEKSGGLNDHLNLYEFKQIHHKPTVTRGVMAQECGQILKDFFKQCRKS